MQKYQKRNTVRPGDQQYRLRFQHCPDAGEIRGLRNKIVAD